ncbi:ester cyclase [Rhodovibrionaceae bacterium A322]
MTPEENIALMHRLTEILNAGDTERVPEVVSPDFQRHDAVRVENGVEDVKRFLIDRHEEYADLVWSISDAVSRGDHVAATVTGEAIHRETGKKVTGDGLILARIEDGKVAEVTSLWDRSNMPGD